MAWTVRSPGTTAGNASGQNLDIDKPTGTVDGDILVCVGYREAGTWTPPTGWAQWGSDQASFDANMLLTVWWKRASSEGASYTWQLSTSTWRVLAMIAIAGAKTSGDPIDVGPTGRGTNEGLPIPIITSVTTTQANTLRLAAHGNVIGADVIVGASSMTEGVGLGGCEWWYLEQASAGASGDKTFASSPSMSAGDWATFHLALAPDTGIAAATLYVSLTDPIVGSASF